MKRARRTWRITPETLDALDPEVRDTLAPLGGQTWATAKDAKTAIKKATGADAKTVNTIVKTIGVPDPDAAPARTKTGALEPAPELRDQENIPLPAGYLNLAEDEREQAVHDAAEQHLAAEIHPWLPDAWIDHTKTKIGYEIPLTRHFYVYTPPRPLEEIDAEIKQLEAEIEELLREVTE